MQSFVLHGPEHVGKSIFRLLFWGKYNHEPRNKDTVMSSRGNEDKTIDSMHFGRTSKSLKISVDLCNIVILF